MVVDGGKCMLAVENIFEATKSLKQELHHQPQAEIKRVILVNATLLPAQQDFAMVGT